VPVGFPLEKAELGGVNPDNDEASTTAATTNTDINTVNDDNIKFLMIFFIILIFPL
jgi:hypothetical protein